MKREHIPSANKTFLDSSYVFFIPSGLNGFPSLKKNTGRSKGNTITNIRELKTVLFVFACLWMLKRSFSTFHYNVVTRITWGTQWHCWCFCFDNLNSLLLTGNVSFIFTSQICLLFASIQHWWWFESKNNSGNIREIWTKNKQ